MWVCILQSVNIHHWQIFPTYLTNSSIRAWILSISYNAHFFSVLQISFPWILSICSAKSIHSSWDAAVRCWSCSCRIKRECDETRATMERMICHIWFTVTYIIGVNNLKVVRYSYISEYFNTIQMMTALQKKKATYHWSF